MLFLKHNQVSSLPCSARSCPQHHLWVIKKRLAKWGMIWDVQFRNVGFPWSQLQESFPKCSNSLLPYAEVIQRELSVRKTRSSAETGKGLLRGHSKHAFSPTAHKVGLLIPFFTLLPTSNFFPCQFPSCIFLKVIMYSSMTMHRPESSLGCWGPLKNSQQSYAFSLELAASSPNAIPSFLLGSSSKDHCLQESLPNLPPHSSRSNHLYYSLTF